MWTWEAEAKKQLDMFKIDRTQSAVAFNLHVGYFQNLMAFMGFTEGLCAMYGGTRGGYGAV